MNKSTSVAQHPYHIGNQVCSVNLFHQVSDGKVSISAMEGDELLFGADNVASCDAILVAVEMIRSVRTDLYRRGMHLDNTYSLTELDYLRDLAEAVIEMEGP